MPRQWSTVSRSDARSRQLQAEARAQALFKQRLDAVFGLMFDSEWDDIHTRAEPGSPEEYVAMLLWLQDFLTQHQPRFDIDEDSMFPEDFRNEFPAQAQAWLSKEFASLPSDLVDTQTYLLHQAESRAYNQWFALQPNTTLPSVGSSIPMFPI